MLRFCAGTSLVGSMRSSLPSRSSWTWWTTRLGGPHNPSILPTPTTSQTPPRSHQRTPPVHPGARDCPLPGPQPLVASPPTHHLPRPLHLPPQRFRREQTPPRPPPPSFSTSAIWLMTCAQRPPLGSPSGPGGLDADPPARVGAAHVVTAGPGTRRCRRPARAPC
ncbi:hypothetical protein H4582DRAFT_1261323 [Lactarius indigo]|nr:hypothetical protein H4582DRAFT_1261323 [Lactarius indigo]